MAEHDGSAPAHPRLGKPAPADQRTDRLARALRENLRKRKQQALTRTSADHLPAPDRPPERDED